MNVQNKLLAVIYIKKFIFDPGKTLPSLIKPRDPWLRYQARFAGLTWLDFMVTYSQVKPVTFAGLPRPAGKDVKTCEYVIRKPAFRGNRYFKY